MLLRLPPFAVCIDYQSLYAVADSLVFSIITFGLNWQLGLLPFLNCVLENLCVQCSFSQISVVLLMILEVLKPDSDCEC